MIKRSLLCLAALLVLSQFAQAQEDRVLVGKIIDIDGPRLYSNRLTPDSWFQGYMGMMTFLQERLRTDDSTQAVLSFLSGGRAGIGVNSAIEIVSSGSVADESGATMRLDAGTFWAKFDKQERPFQIKTTGGVIGIEGTELLIGVEEDTGITEILLFEGQVRVTEEDGKETVLNPGDYMTCGGDTGGGCVLSYPTANLRNLVVERFPEFSSFLAAHDVTSIPQSNSFVLSRSFYPKRVDLVSALESASTHPGEASISGLQARTDDGRPDFSWERFADAASYGFYLSSDEEFEELLFSGHTEGLTFELPESAEGVEAGNYHWGVLPLDEEGRPLAPLTRATLETQGWTSAGFPSD